MSNSQLVEGYARVVALLKEHPRGHEITLMDVVSALATEMGVSKPDTLRRHTELMCHMGYLELTDKGNVIRAPRYRIGRGCYERKAMETVGSKNEAAEAGAKT